MSQPWTRHPRQPVRAGPCPCLGGAGTWVKATQKEGMMRSPGTDREEAAKPLHLLGSVAQDGLFPRRRRETFFHFLPGSLPQPILPQLLPHRKQGQFSGGCSYPKLGLRKQGCGGHSDSSILSQISPSHYYRTVRTVIPKPNTKGKRRACSNLYCQWDLYSNSLTAERSPYGGYFATTEYH